MEPTKNCDTPLVVINVSDVSPAKEPLPEVSYKSAVEALLTKPPSRRASSNDSQSVANPAPVEACTRYHGRLVGEVRYHPFVASVHMAFSDHRPLVLSPDIIWILIAQGFANHVNCHAENLRSRLVKHSGKARIRVQRDDFIKGSLENPWPEVFSEFSKQIRNHIGQTTHSLLTPHFSTTDAISVAAAEVVLLDAMQSYFSYEFATLCGIPQVVLEGTPEDWETLADRVRGLADFGLKWWVDAVTPVLDEIASAARDQINPYFWKSIYKVDDGSGGPYITGWITSFFPYLKDPRTGLASLQNRWIAQGGEPMQKLLYPSHQRDREGMGQGPTLSAFPSGLARAPFRWLYYERSFEMEFLGGLVGVRQDPKTLRLRPEIGWAVREQRQE